MADNVTNEPVLNLLEVLQEEAKKTRMERREILDELRAIKGHVSVLVQSDGSVTNELLLEYVKAIHSELSAMREDIWELRDRQVEAHRSELARKVDTLDN